MKKTIACVMVLALAGCSTVGKYQNPAVSESQQQVDQNDCKQTGMRVGGYIAGSIGILMIPVGLVLAVPGFIMAAKASDIEKKCLETRGYTKQQDTAEAQ